MVVFDRGKNGVGWVGLLGGIQDEKFAIVAETQAGELGDAGSSCWVILVRITRCAWRQVSPKIA
jgi:hypothetical protein